MLNALFCSLGELKEPFRDMSLIKSKNSCLAFWTAYKVQKKDHLKWLSDAIILPDLAISHYTYITSS